MALGFALCLKAVTFDEPNGGQRLIAFDPDSADGAIALKDMGIAATKLLKQADAVAIEGSSEKGRYCSGDGDGLERMFPFQIFEQAPG